MLLCKTTLLNPVQNSNQKSGGMHVRSAGFYCFVRYFLTVSGFLYSKPKVSTRMLSITSGLKV